MEIACDIRITRQELLDGGPSLFTCDAYSNVQQLVVEDDVFEYAKKLLRSLKSNKVVVNH